MFEDPLLKQKNETKSYTINLTNIGLCAAHDIRIQIIYDIEEILSQFHGFDKIVLNDDGNVQYKMVSGNSYGIRIDNSYKEEKHISYLLSTETYELALPDIIHNVITILPYLKLQAGKLRKGDEQINDNFSIRLSYRDISNREYIEINKIIIKTYLAFDSQFYGVGDITFIKE